MPELPEIVVISRQMDETIVGKEISSVEIYQPKCLNRKIEDYQTNLPDKKITAVEPVGKWIRLRMDSEAQLLINLGMGGEIINFTDLNQVPDKTKLLVRFTDESGFYVTLWWFGYFHLVLKDERNPMTDELGDDPLQLNFDQFSTKFDGRRGQIKPLLLNQKFIRGIGNFYIQEILFQAKIHPQRLVQSLSEKELKKLFGAIHGVLHQSIDLGSSSYELDFFGKKGKYDLKQLSFAYQENAPCPVCDTLTEKIKTGSNAQYICPQCQKKSLPNNGRSKGNVQKEKKAFRKTKLQKQK